MRLRHVLGTLCTVLILLGSGSVRADSIKTANFLIPGGEGGGWDTTGRETGKALRGAS